MASESEATSDGERTGPDEFTGFEELPNTDIDVDAHVHFGMAGSFPLRLAELFFATDGVHIVEYGYITPLIGLGSRKHRREARAMLSVFDVHGLDEVLLQGDSVTWLNYANVERVVLHDGGRIGRAKLTVYTVEGFSYAYRLHDHDETEFEDVTDRIEDSGDRHGFAVEVASGVGFAPRESVRRFFTK